MKSASSLCNALVLWVNLWMRFLSKVLQANANSRHLPKPRSSLKAPRTPR